MTKIDKTSQLFQHCQACLYLSSIRHMTQSRERANAIADFAMVVKKLDSIGYEWYLTQLAELYVETDENEKAEKVLSTLSVENYQSRNLRARLAKSESNQIPPPRPVKKP